MENVIGKAKSYLEEKGIDTSNMTLEEIMEKYRELMAEESGKEEPVKEEHPEVENDEIQDEKTEIDTFLEANNEIISTFNEEQAEVFNKLIEIARKSEE